MYICIYVCVCMCICKYTYMCIKCYIGVASHLPSIIMADFYFS